MNKQAIAKNALFLFFRSIVTICIGLFASRVLLQKLGVDDYGVYNVVGGIVIMFNSLRTFFSSAIQRFLNYSKGLNDNTLLNNIFNTGLEIQLVLAAIFLIIMESVGLLFLYNLNLTEVQFSSARIIYQLSVFTAIVSILTVPYDALIIANERMNIFAWFSILDSTLRLVIIYLIHKGPFSNLVNYAILLLLVSIVIRSANALYCKFHFQESKLRRVWDKKLMKRMGQFAGWNFLGNTGFSLTHEGINYILNIMGGVAVNAARAIVYQVMSALNIFVGNINVAFKPQTNASVVEDDKRNFNDLLCYNAKATVSFYLLLILPVVIFARPLVQLWLGQIPDYVVSFIIAISVYYLVRAFHTPIDLFYNSIGELKLYQVIELSLMLLNLPLAYIFLSNDLPYWSVFLGMALVEVLNHISIVTLATVKYGFPLHKFMHEVYKPFVYIVIVCFSILYVAFIRKVWEQNLFVIIVTTFVVECAVLIAIYSIVMNTMERNSLKLMFKRLLKINTNE